ncbi:MAG: hypothetical protein QMB62_13230, partial [Oscillospiraceae bacterium]
MQSNGFATQGNLSSGGKFWYAFNANQLFMRRRGNCIPYACAMAYMAKVIADIKGISVEEAAELTNRNGKCFFGIS